MEIYIGLSDEAEKLAVDAFLEGFKIEEEGSQIGGKAIKIRKANKKKLPGTINEATAKVNSMILVTRKNKDIDETSP